MRFVSIFTGAVFSCAALVSNPALAAPSSKSVDDAFDKAIAYAQECKDSDGTARACNKILPQLSRALGKAARHCAESNRPRTDVEVSTWNANCKRWNAAMRSFGN